MALGRGFIPFPTPPLDNPPFASVRIGEEGLGRETESGEHLCNKKRIDNPNVINIKENQPVDAIFEVQS